MPMSAAEKKRLEALETWRLQQINHNRIQEGIDATTDSRLVALETAQPPAGGDTSAIVAEITALKNSVALLTARIAELENTVSTIENDVQVLEDTVAAGGGGSLPTGTVSNLTVTGKLTVRGEIDLWATNSNASRAFTIINPKGSSFNDGYPMIRWEREQADGSKKFLFGLVTHEVATDGSTHKHFSMYRAVYNSTSRESVFDYDFDVSNVGSSPRPYLDIENTEIRLNKGTTLRDKNGNEVLG